MVYIQYLVSYSSKGHGMGHQGVPKDQPVSFTHVLHRDTKHQLMVKPAHKKRKKETYKAAEEIIDHLRNKEILMLDGILDKICHINPGFEQLLQCSKAVGINGSTRKIDSPQRHMENPDHSTREMTS